MYFFKFPAVHSSTVTIRPMRHTHDPFDLKASQITICLSKLDLIHRRRIAVVLLFFRVEGRRKRSFCFLCGFAPTDGTQLPQNWCEYLQVRKLSSSF